VCGYTLPCGHQCQQQCHTGPHAACAVPVLVACRCGREKQRMACDRATSGGLVSVGNGKRTGGVFFMTPHADPFDGRLTFMHGYRSTRLGMFNALPSAMKSAEGNIAEQDGIHEIDCTWLKFNLDNPSPAHTDGELFDMWIQDFEYKIFPSAVPILVP
jgi:diacylglycerol kinase family enzyme